ncbi:hypothetical protein SK128_015306 [Halocaridina rubra]|uniref:Uncharacterized protein n=1 Tax=Halocaridina rubra TaxID=373956 RepID=A0AAN9A2H1_HALRR
MTTGNSIGPRFEKPDNKFEIGAINVATLRDKQEEFILVMKERKLDVLALAETQELASSKYKHHRRAGQ